MVCDPDFLFVLRWKTSFTFYRQTVIQQLEFSFCVVKFRALWAFDFRNMQRRGLSSCRCSERTLQKPALLLRVFWRYLPLPDMVGVTVFIRPLPQTQTWEVDQSVAKILVSRLLCIRFSTHFDIRLLETHCRVWISNSQQKVCVCVCVRERERERERRLINAFVDLLI